MRLTSDSVGEVLITEASLIESFDSIGSHFHLRVGSGFSGNCTLTVSGKDLKCVVYSSYVTNSAIYVDLITTSQEELYKSNSLPVCAQYTTSDFIAASGFSCHPDSDKTQNLWWVFPQFSYFNFLQVVSDYSFGLSGGAMFTNVALDGNIRLYDFLYRLNYSEQTLVDVVKDCSIIHEHSPIYVNVPGVNLCGQNYDFTTESVSMDSDYSKMSIVPIFNDYALDIQSRFYQNRASRTSIREVLINFTTPQVLPLGSVVLINNVRAVVSSVKKYLELDSSPDDVHFNEYQAVCQVL